MPLCQIMIDFPVKLCKYISIYAHMHLDIPNPKSTDKKKSQLQNPHLNIPNLKMCPLSLKEVRGLK